MKTLLGRVGFAIVNLWLVFHLLAIVVAPATVGPSSRSAQTAWEFVSPYLQAVYLNHGFHYFAPEPGGSSILAYELHFDDERSLSGRIPNRNIEPRLLYHRHFMLTEYLGGSEPEEQQLLARTYAEQLCRKHGAKAATLTLVRHDLSMMSRVRAGGELTDRDLYDEEPLGTFQCKLPAQ